MNLAVRGIDADIKWNSDGSFHKDELRDLKADFVLAKPGSCAVIPDWLSEANCSDVVVVRANPRVRPSFISYVVNSSAAHHIDAHTVGAVQQHFNVSSARQIRFQLPPIAEQDRILTLAATRDLLLPKLMSGEIRVRDAEKAVEATQ